MSTTTSRTGTGEICFYFLVAVCTTVVDPVHNLHDSVTITGTSFVFYFDGSEFSFSTMFSL